jgi:hypothetical protein
VPTARRETSRARRATTTLASTGATARWTASRARAAAAPPRRARRARRSPRRMDRHVPQLRRRQGPTSSPTNDWLRKNWCGRCGCNRNEGERPDYHWARATTTSTGVRRRRRRCGLPLLVAIVVGQATEPQPGAMRARGARSARLASDAARGAPRRGPAEDYLLHCSGCHQRERRGRADRVPRSRLAPFLARPKARLPRARARGRAVVARRRGSRRC